MDFDQAVTFLARKLPESPSVFIICTNALGNFPIDLESPIKFPCDEIPHFPPQKDGQVPLHLLYGRVSGVPVLVQQGRYHHFEGYTTEEITFPVRVAGCLGCKRMLATNAAGTLNDGLDLGDVMLLRSHLDLTGLQKNPGRMLKDGEKHLEENSKVYDGDFVRMAAREAVEEGMDKYVKTGVYGMIGDSIPNNYSVIHSWKRLGIDAVGTSLIPEVQTASKLGMEVSGLSILTDKGILNYNDHPDPLLEDVSKAVDAKKPFVAKIMLKFIERSNKCG